MIIDSESYVLNTISGEAFVLVNKKLLKHLKGDGTLVVFLSELLSMHKYYLNNQDLEVDNSFPVPISRIQHSIGMSSYKQESAILRLTETHLIYAFTKGFPKRRYVIINFDSIVKILLAKEARIKNDTQPFYDRLNTALNTGSNGISYSEQDIHALIEPACDKTNGLLRGTIILLSQYFRKMSPDKVEWTPESVGKVRAWINKRSIGKPFDFSIIKRTADILPVTTEFNTFISSFIYTAKGVQEVHPDDQVYEYSQLLK
jgi:hypothetical protein